LREWNAGTVQVASQALPPDKIHCVARRCLPRKLVGLVGILCLVHGHVLMTDETISSWSSVDDNRLEIWWHSNSKRAFDYHVVSVQPREARVSNQSREAAMRPRSLPRPEYN
jgi:hypothetical protein